jgi:betaine lipid synthase
MDAESLTKVIVMDSLDCRLPHAQTNTSGFDPIPASTPLPPPFTEAHAVVTSTPEEAYEHLRSELDYEIMEMRRVLAVGGHAVWRSAAKYPWYRLR